MSKKNKIKDPIDHYFRSNSIQVINIFESKINNDVVIKVKVDERYVKYINRWKINSLDDQKIRTKRISVIHEFAYFSLAVSKKDIEKVYEELKLFVIYQNTNHSLETQIITNYTNLATKKINKYGNISVFPDENIQALLGNVRILKFGLSKDSSDYFIKVNLNKNIVAQIINWKLVSNNDSLEDVLLVTRKMVTVGNQVQITLSFPVTKIIKTTQYWKLRLITQNESGQESVTIITQSNLITKLKLLPDGYRYAVSDHNHVMYPTILSNMDFAIQTRITTLYEMSKYVKKAWLTYFSIIIFLPFIRLLNIWVFYEKNANSAHENAWITFKKMRKLYPNRRIYYIINSEAKKSINLNNDNIVLLGTWKYYVILYLAKVLLSSETRYHVLGDAQFHRSMLSNKLSKKVHVFLQHGMNGIKKVPMFHYGHGQIDFLIAASNWEKDVITHKWHYPEKQVFVTGLPRWDDLNIQNLEKGVITFMPTWQSNLADLSHKSFERTSFFKSYSGLFLDENFINVVQNDNLEVNIVMHPKFEQYKALFQKFKFLNIHVSADLNYLLSRSEILITDYSSVAWDALYLNRKVVFFQPEIRQEEDNMSIFNEIGTVATDKNDLISAIIKKRNVNFENYDAFFEPKTDYNTVRVINTLVENEKLFKLHFFTYLHRKLIKRLKK